MYFFNICQTARYNLLLPLLTTALLACTFLSGCQLLLPCLPCRRGFGSFVFFIHSYIRTKAKDTASKSNGGSGCFRRRGGEAFRSSRQLREPRRVFPNQQHSLYCVPCSLRLSPRKDHRTEALTTPPLTSAQAFILGSGYFLQCRISHCRICTLAIF